jgi:ribose-phosphate pyrophosphokinase
VILSGNSHPSLVDSVCGILSVPPCNRILTKFSVGESRCEIKDSVRGKDVYIVQSGGGAVNDHFVDLCISKDIRHCSSVLPALTMRQVISACKTGSARRVTAVLPLFPYSRQPDVPYNKTGAPLSKPPAKVSEEGYTFESVPATPGPGVPKSNVFGNGTDMTRMFSKMALGDNRTPRPGFGASSERIPSMAPTSQPGSDVDQVNSFQAQRGYRQWVAQAGTLIANLLTCAGADQ